MNNNGGMMGLKEKNECVIMEFKAFMFYGFLTFGVEVKMMER